MERKQILADAEKQAQYLADMDVKGYCNAYTELQCEEFKAKVAKKQAAMDFREATFPKKEAKEEELWAKKNIKIYNSSF